MHTDKRETTHAAIIDQAIRDACKVGIERLSFSALAERLEMSKSGVYGHFGSLGALQLELVDMYCQRFEQQVFDSARAASAGLPRLRSIFGNWCRLVGAGMWLEVLPLCGSEDAEGLTALARQSWIGALTNWRKQLGACVSDAVLAGQLDAGTDQAQLGHDIYGLIIALHHQLRTFGNVEAMQRTVRTFHLLLGLAGGERGSAKGELACRAADKSAIADSWLTFLGARIPVEGEIA